MANGSVVANPGWNEDIRGMLAPFTAQMMWRLNLGDYEQVKANANIIYDRINDGGMPPEPFPPLTPEQIQTFYNWKESGCPQTRPTTVSASAPAAAQATPAANLQGKRPMKFP